MRRRALLHPQVIEASRGFVNVRLNSWLNEENHKRLKTLTGGYFGHVDNTQNTVYCMFEPYAPGLTVDSFPTEDSVFFGTRPGKRGSFVLPSAADFTRQQLFNAVTKMRRTDTGGTDMDPERIKRIVWEYENVYDATTMAKLMDDLVARFPLKEGAAEGTPVLPVMANLTQALNVAASDSYATLVVVHPSERDQAMEQRVARLAFEDGIAGRTYIARLTVPEWVEAHETGQISGGSLTPGVYFVAPDSFGLDGEVWAEIPQDATQDRMRTELVAVLDRFLHNWQKLDRASHCQAGSDKNISWTEFDPDMGGIVRIGPGSKKLGKNYVPLSKPDIE